MKSDLQIKKKMELLDSPAWLEGRAAYNLLNDYHTEVRARDEVSLKHDLEIEVLGTLRQLLDGAEVMAKLSMVRIQIILWMLDDVETIKLVHAVPMDRAYIEKRLDIVIERHEIKDPTGQSEEE